MAPEDEKLLIEAAQRDPGRFADLYERNFQRVYGYVARRVRNREEAEDVTAQVFLEALAALPKFEWRGVAFIAWLLRIAANALRDRWQHAQREADDSAAGFPEPAEVPEIEKRALLFELVDRLPEEQRRVVFARFVERRSVREIAAELARSEGAVKQLQLRALKTLRARMGRADG